MKRFLGTFRCSKDADLEEFLHDKAIMFEDKGRSRTYLLLDDEYLIGQLAKDDSVKDHIGHYLMDAATEQLKVSYMQNGGRVMCIDCKEPMIGYYENEGFVLVEPSPNRKSGLYRLVRLF